MNDLGYDDRPAHAGDRVRRLDVDDLARLHAVARHAERYLPGLDVDGGAPGHLGDRDRRALADADDRLAAEQEAGERLLAGDDAILLEHVVLELQDDRLWGHRARRRHVALERRDDTGLRGLG